MLSNQLEALNLGPVCHMTGKRVKNNSVVVSISLVLLVHHAVHAMYEVHAWVVLLLACKANSRAPRFYLVCTTQQGPGLLPLATPQGITPLCVPRPMTRRLVTHTHMRAHVL